MGIYLLNDASYTISPVENIGYFTYPGLPQQNLKTFVFIQVVSSKPPRRFSFAVLPVMQGHKWHKKMLGELNNLIYLL